MLRDTAFLRRWARKALYGLALLASTAGSYLVINALLQRHRPKSAATAVLGSDPSGGKPVNPFASAHGTNLIAFVVTASDCGWSKRPAGMEALRTLSQKIRAVHSGSYAQVSVIGVALDRNLDSGLQFLSQIANGKPSTLFDQVFIGGSWLNEQIVRFVWRERVTEAAIPQVLVIERPVNSESYLKTFAITVKDDQVVANPAGVGALVTWIKQGLPLERRRAASRSERTK